ncbi:MAG: glycosyltransferase [Kiritimatiellia bacterium]|nr:glycosyltransferase [Lentisphaerota bacterium]
MRILVISKLLPSAGGVSGAQIVFNRIKCLLELGHIIDVLCFIPAQSHDGPALEHLRGLVRRLEVLPEPKRLNPLRCGVFNVFSRVPYPFCLATSWAMSRKVSELVRQERYHVAVAEFSEMGQYLYGNLSLIAVRRVVSCHECRTASWARAMRVHMWRYGGVGKRLNFRRLRRYEFDMYRNMDHVLALTSQERHELLKYAPNLRVSVASPGVNLPPPIKPARPPGRCLLFVGCYANEANRDAVNWFARAIWPALKERYPDLVFYVVGYGVTPDIRELGRRDPGIIVTGAVEDLRPYLAKARVFICPFRMGGGFHVKNLEAMAAGVPVVSTSIGAAGIPSWDGESILLADSPRQFFRCVSLLLDDPGVCQALAERARPLVQRFFTSAHEQQVLSKVLNDIMREER